MPSSSPDDLAPLLAGLLAQAGVENHQDLVRKMIRSALAMGAGDNTRGDLKIVATALDELERSYAAFAPYRHRRKCSIFGSARTGPDTAAYRDAKDVGQALAAAGWMVITGGGPGVMTAGIEGAGPENSFGITIRLPFETQDGGGLLPPDRLVGFRYFFTRKLTFMKEASAYVVMPGGFGTLDETFELLTLVQTGKEYPCPIVLFEPDGDTYWRHWREFVERELVPPGLVAAQDLDLVHITSSAQEAVDYIDGFYRVYHSLRYVDGRPVLRLSEDVDDATIARLNAQFSDIFTDMKLSRTMCSQQERRDHDNVDLPRLTMGFNNRSFARLHELVCSLSSSS